MANGFGSLYIGASGLQNAQYALNTTANNLANVDTTGYVRQQVRFADNSYNTIKQAMGNVNLQQYGLGVTIGDVVHARDIFLDKAYRQEAGRQSFYSAQYETVNYVEDLMQELNGEEFKDSLSDLCQAFQELAVQPEETVNQNLVLEKAELFISRTTDLYKDFQNYQDNINEQIKDDVDRVNEIGNRIYELNIEIQKIEAGGIETAMTLRDERDNLLDELGSYGTISVREDASGFTYVDFEYVEFVTDIKCYEIGLDKDTKSGTGFYTPYWPQMTGDTSNLYKVFDTEDKISTDINTDVGGIKSLLMARGDKYGRYEDLAEDRYTSVVGDENTMGSTMVEVEAELDQLFHSIVTAINDLYAPKTTVEAAVQANNGTLTTDADGNFEVVTGTDDQGNDITMTLNVGEWKALDLSKCSYGVDGAIPEELFVRNGSDNYMEVTIDGNTYYLYRNEDESIDATRYGIGNVSINANYKRQLSLMPAFTENGAVDMELGSNLRAVWTDAKYTLNPSDKNHVTLEEYYNKMVNNLGVMGNTYKSASETLEVSVASYDSERQQVIGVSSDEELTKMIKYQAAYNAASRYMTVISEMTELIVTGLI